MKYLILTASLIASFECAVAENRSPLMRVYVQGPQVDVSDYLAEVKSDPRAQTYSQFKIENRVDPILLTQLKNLFLEAQKNFLKNENSRQIEEWRVIAQMADKADWPSATREMIQIAWVRMAQLSKNVKTETAYLKRAVQIDPYLDFRQLPVPTSVLTRIDEIQKSASYLTISMARFQGYTHLLINGSVFSLEDRADMKIISGAHRFTWISNQFTSVTKVLETEKLQSYVPDTTTLANGNCEKPVWSTPPPPENIQFQIVYPLECVASWPSPQKPGATQSRIENEWADRENSISTQFTPPQTQKPFYERPQFWIGAAVVGGILLYWQQSAEESPRPPTRRVGLE